MGRPNHMSLGGVVPRTFRFGQRPFQCEPLEARRLLAVGDLDRSFDFDGIGQFDAGNGVTVEAMDVAVQLDGKTVIVGMSSTDEFAVARLNLDGTPDLTFGPAGTGLVLTDIDAGGYANAVAVQGDGRIVVVGTAEETSGINNRQHAVVRYLPDGSLDSSFDGDGIKHFNIGSDVDSNIAYDVAIQGDGKIVVAGESIPSITEVTFDFTVVRLNPDGGFDTSFGFFGVSRIDFSNSRSPVVAIDYNGTPATNPYYGSIVVAGSDHVDPNTESVIAVARLDPDGRLSSGFDGDGKASFRYPGRLITEGNAVLVQPGGRIVVAGSTPGIGAAHDFLLVRYNPDGTRDGSFGGAGTGYVLTDFDGRNDHAFSIIPNYNSDRLLVGGLSNNGFALARYTNDGVLDTAFQSGGKVISPVSAGRSLELAPGPGRRFTAVGGTAFRAARYLDEGANMVAIGSFDPNGGSESGREQAHFLVSRTERLPTPLRVYLGISGTAAAPIFFDGEDYNADGFSLSAFVGGSFVDIPANQTFVSVSITPVDDTLAEGHETAGFSIIPDPSYDIGTPAGVTLELHDNDASTLYAVEDAHVRADAPAGNFGAARLLETRAGDAGSGQARETYLKFDTSPLDGRRFSSVRLRVFGRLSGGATPVPVEVFGVSASGWGENAITFNNRPPASTTALSSAQVGGPTDFPYTFDVTDFVNREKAAGRGVVSLLLRNAAVSAAPTLWSSRFSEYSDPRLIVTGSIAAPGATPRVTQVFAGSTAWSPAFRQSVEDAGLGDSVWGYAVGGGANQLRSLPWGDVDKISIRFNTAVTVAPEHLSVRGVRGGEYNVSGFAYDEENFVATWTLATPLGRGGTGAGAGDKVLLDLDGDIGTGVASAFLTPRYLDGEWANGADAYDSGDGAQGGDFRFQVNSLRGDVDGDGRVGGTDLSLLRARVTRRASDPFSAADTAYSPRYDINGDGRVDPRDTMALRAGLFSRLPVAAPLTSRRLPGVRQRSWDALMA